MAQKQGFWFVFWPLFFFFLFLPFLILSNSVLAAGVLPDTGQTKCYNDTSEIPCPVPGDPFYGQDGNYQGSQLAYQISANGLVVTDINTGLVWQRADDGSTKDWAAASVYCENLVLGGYSDWRIPSRQELLTIVDYGRYNPAIDPAFSCRDSWYWSGTNGLNMAWVVNFSSGYAGGSVEKTQFFYVRCVR